LEIVSSSEVLTWGFEIVRCRGSGYGRKSKQGVDLEDWNSERREREKREQGGREGGKEGEREKSVCVNFEDRFVSKVQGTSQQFPRV